MYATIGRRVYTFPPPMIFCNTVYWAVALLIYRRSTRLYSAFLLALLRMYTDNRHIIQGIPCFMDTSCIATATGGLEPSSSPLYRGALTAELCSKGFLSTAQEPQKALDTRYVYRAVCYTASDKSLLRIAPLKHVTYTPSEESNPASHCVLPLHH